MKADKFSVRAADIIRTLSLLKMKILSDRDYGIDTKGLLIEHQKYVKAVRKEYKRVLVELMKPVSPRSSKKILEQILEVGRVTPELMEEIRAALAKKDKNPRPRSS